MKRNGYKARLIDNKVDEYLLAFGAVCIEGPNGVGKRGHHLPIPTVKYLLAIPREIFRTVN